MILKMALPIQEILTEKNISSTGVISVDNEMGYLPLSIYEEFLIWAMDGM